MKLKRNNSNFCASRQRRRMKNKQTHKKVSRRHVQFSQLIQSFID